jgi:PhnB protein
MPLIPYLTVKNADAAIAFYKTAFGAEETLRLASRGMVGHAEMKIGDAQFMLSDEFPEMDILGPETRGGSPVVMHLYVDDVDAFVARAVAAGAKVLRPVEDQFYGDRGGKLVDPFGHLWWFATHKEDVSPEEMKRRAAALFGG